MKRLYTNLNTAECHNISTSVGESSSTHIEITSNFSSCPLPSVLLFQPLNLSTIFQIVQIMAGHDLPLTVLDKLAQPGEMV